jgi:uncharacterized protein YodC (DUF2158 family)
VEGGSSTGLKAGVSPRYYERLQMKIDVSDAEVGKKVIEVDLFGMAMTQFMADKLWATINTSSASCVDITLRNVAVSSGSLPRFVIDYGELYETLCEVAKEYREYRQDRPPLPRFVKLPVTVGSAVRWRDDGPRFIVSDISPDGQTILALEEVGSGFRYDVEIHWYETDVWQVEGRLMQWGESEELKAACAYAETLEARGVSYQGIAHMLSEGAPLEMPADSEPRLGWNGFGVNPNSYWGTPQAESKNVRVNESGSAEVADSGWTCDNHAEPIHYTDGTETCYCGRGR